MVRVGPSSLSSPDVLRLPVAALAGTMALVIPEPVTSDARCAAMMKLLSNPLSPYGRKVKIAMAMKGLKDQIEIVQVEMIQG